MSVQSVYQYCQYFDIWESFCEICAKMSIVIWTENENKIGGHQMLTEGRDNIIITLSRTYNGFDIYFMAGKSELIQISTTDPGLG